MEYIIILLLIVLIVMIFMQNQKSDNGGDFLSILGVLKPTFGVLVEWTPSLNL